jgi:hypothetical protein
MKPTSERIQILIIALLNALHRGKRVLGHLEHNLLSKPHIPNDLQAVQADDTWDCLETLQEVTYLLK